MTEDNESEFSIPKEYAETLVYVKRGSEEHREKIMTDKIKNEVKDGKGLLYDLYNKHKALRNEEKYKDHELVINFHSYESEPGNKMISLHMINKTTGEDLLIESVDFQIEG